MSKAGIDCGSTLVKAVWMAGPHLRLATLSDNVAAQAAIQTMRSDGVKHIRLTGTGAADFPASDFAKVTRGDGIDDEIRMQADGTRWLLSRATASAPRKFILASVGTGISYTTVSGRKAKRSPLGSSHGGGTIMGLAGLVGITDFAALTAAAARGTPPDLLVKDKLPATNGTPTGELIIAHFAKANASVDDTCAGIFSFAAASVFKDLAVLRMIPFSPKDIVIVGTVGGCEVFQSYLKKFAPFLKAGTNLHFPAQGEYAAAAGALLAVTED
jgi:pantothenate kinase